MITLKELKEIQRLKKLRGKLEEIIIDLETFQQILIQRIEEGEEIEPNDLGVYIEVLYADVTPNWRLELQIELSKRPKDWRVRLGEIKNKYIDTHGGKKELKFNKEEIESVEHEKY